MMGDSRKDRQGHGGNCDGRKAKRSECHLAPPLNAILCVIAIRKADLQLDTSFKGDVPAAMATIFTLRSFWIRFQPLQTRLSK
jgi:hypothetical protein